MKPLQDVRIVSLEQYGAGPFGTVHLADLGAEVIKIEDPQADGDVGRYVPPFAEGEDSLFFETFNRNKQSLSLDITCPAGRGVFEDLVRRSDAVYSNLRGDVPAKMRITYDDLRHLNPAIVCCSLSGFGMTGPRSAEPGYDYILQGLAGWMSVTGEPGGPPAKTGLSLVDYSGGFVAALALLAALHAARRDGTGMDCDLSLYDTAVSLLTYPATWYLNEGWTPQRTRHSAHPSLVPFQNFQAADGWLVVGCAKEKFWQRLTGVLQRPDLAADPRFATFASRGEHADALLPVLEAEFARKTVAQWLSLLYAAAIPCGPVNDMAGALADEHTAARGLIVETDHPRFGRVRQLASPVRVGDAAPDYRRAPARDEDRERILRDLLGYDQAEIAGLEQRGAFGRRRRVPRRRVRAPRPPRRRADDRARPTLSRQLAAWAHDLALDQVPDGVRRAACLHLLDGLGTALAAALARAAEPAVQVAAGLGGPPEATILGTGTRVSAPAAALANGTLLHALDFDDTHPGGLVHATAAVLPAALAVGEQAGASGAEVLRTAIAGYEAVCRIAAAAPHGFHARGIHATSACGVFSAALIAALLARSPVPVITDALGMAGSAAGGLLEFLSTGASTKQLHPGMAAHSGILAARLAAAGATGPASVLEGGKGLYAALSARPASLARVLDGLGQRWETAAVGIKPYPACQLLHATLDAVGRVLAQVPDPGEVVSVVACVHPDSAAIVCEPWPAKLRPRTAYDAKFSLPWSVAALLADRAVGLSTYSAESIARPQVAELASRVRAVRTAGDGPAADAAGRVDIVLTDGRTVTGEVPGSRGTAAEPMTDADVIAKFTANCGGSPVAAELAGAVLGLAALPSLRCVPDLARRVIKEGAA